MRWRSAVIQDDYEIVEPGRVGMGRSGASGFIVERDPARISFTLHEPPSPETLVHPLLTVPLSVLARWRGDVTLHAGAFETPAGAWMVLGTREAGKSTTLAALGARGVPIVADDLVVIEGHDVWAGPHCVDLRPDVAERFPAAQLMGEVGNRPRYRLSTVPGRARLPLRGMFLLDWHDRATLETTPLPGPVRLQLLYQQEYIGLLGPAQGEQILDLMGIAGWRVSRPADWAATPYVLDQMLHLTTDQA